MTGRMERVKEALRTREEICSLSDLYANALSNGRNDVSTLRSRGWVIECSWHKHGKDAHKHYRLVGEPAPEQRELIAV